MKNIRTLFQTLPEGTGPPNGYQRIHCHIIFDVKMQDFSRKAQCVASGHCTEAPATITYASVVSLETARLALTIAALNDLTVKVGDVLNSLTPMVAYMPPLFLGLCNGVVNSLVLVLQASQRHQ